MSDNLDTALEAQTELLDLIGEKPAMKSHMSVGIAKDKSGDYYLKVGVRSHDVEGTLPSLIKGIPVIVEYTGPISKQ